MPLALASRIDKARIIDLLRRVFQEFLFPGQSIANREALLNHLEWMSRQPDILNTSCRFETFPEAKVTRIVIECSFSPIPGFKAH